MHVMNVTGVYGVCSPSTESHFQNFPELFTHMNRSEQFLSFAEILHPLVFLMQVNWRPTTQTEMETSMWKMLKFCSASTFYLLPCWDLQFFHQRTPTDEVDSGKHFFNGWWSVAEHNRPEWSRQGVEPKQTSVLKVCSARQLCLTAEGHKRSQQWSLNSWLLS